MRVFLYVVIDVFVVVVVVVGVLCILFDPASRFVRVG